MSSPPADSNNKNPVSAGVFGELATWTLKGYDYLTNQAKASGEKNVNVQAVGVVLSSQRETVSSGLSAAATGLSKTASAAISALDKAVRRGDKVFLPPALPAWLEAKAGGSDPILGAAAALWPLGAAAAACYSLQYAVENDNRFVHGADFAFRIPHLPPSCSCSSVAVVADASRAGPGAGFRTRLAVILQQEQQQQQQQQPQPSSSSAAAGVAATVPRDQNNQAAATAGSAAAVAAGSGSSLNDYDVVPVDSPSIAALEPQGLRPRLRPLANDDDDNNNTAANVDLLGGTVAIRLLDMDTARVGAEPSTASGSTPTPATPVSSVWRTLSSRIQELFDLLHPRSLFREDDNNNGNEFRKFHFGSAFLYTVSAATSLFALRSISAHEIKYKSSLLPSVSALLFGTAASSSSSSGSGNVVRSLRLSFFCAVGGALTHILAPSLSLAVRSLASTPPAAASVLVEQAATVSHFAALFFDAVSPLLLLAGSPSLPSIAKVPIAAQWLFTSGTFLRDPNSCTSCRHYLSSASRWSLFVVGTARHFATLIECAPAASESAAKMHALPRLMSMLLVNIHLCSLWLPMTAAPPSTVGVLTGPSWTCVRLFGANIIWLLVYLASTKNVRDAYPQVGSSATGSTSAPLFLLMAEAAALVPSRVKTLWRQYNIVIVADTEAAAATPPPTTTINAAAAATATATAVLHTNTN